VTTLATDRQGCQEGRAFRQYPQVLKYTKTSNSGEIFHHFLAPFLASPLPCCEPYSLDQSVNDGIPAWPGREPERRSHAPPATGTRESICAKGLGAHIVWVDC
jgi:hypothetical protein